MRVLVACEYSGRVRDAFVRQGHEAVSCDILPCSVSWGQHIEGDVREVIEDSALAFDLMVAFPPCTYLAVSGARWWAGRQQEQREALDFVRYLLGAPIPKIALENPVGKISTAIRKPDQYFQPWEHGHGETKKTGLWLKGLPKLQPSKVVSGRQARIHQMAPGPNRSKLRSLTYMGVARAMAEQWG